MYFRRIDVEILDLYDARRNKLTKHIIRETEKVKNGEYKQSVHIWIMNSKNEFLLEKRAYNMETNPGKWAFVGGVVDTGETSLEGALRETREELGIDIDVNQIELMFTFKRKEDFVDVWIARKDIELSKLILQKEEVCEAKWVEIDELENMINREEFVPAIKLYYNFFKNLLYTFYLKK